MSGNLSSVCGAVANPFRQARAAAGAGWLRLAIACATVGAGAAAQTEVTDPPLAYGEPGAEFESPPGYDDCTLFESADKRLLACGAYSKHESTVIVRGRYFVDGDRSKEVESVRTWRVGYFPTWVATVGENVMCVAGKRATGNTVIELWTFAAPVHTYAYSELGGPPEHTVTIASPSVSVLYDANTAGRRIVRTCVPIFGGPALRILVQFADSNELCALDVQQKTLTLVATPDPARAVGGVFLLPLLTQKYRNAYVVEHPTWGWCFMLSELADTPPDDPSAANLVFLNDQDKDGVIDHAQQLSPSEFEALGFCDANNFLWNWKY